MPSLISLVKIRKSSTATIIYSLPTGFNISCCGTSKGKFIKLNTKSISVWLLAQNINSFDKKLLRLSVSKMWLSNSNQNKFPF